MEWSEHFALDGRPYYYNSRTGESVWERPAQLQPALPAVDPALMHSGFVGGPAFYSQRGPADLAPHAAAAFAAPSFDAYAYGGSFGAAAPAALGFGSFPMLGPGPPIQKGKQASGPAGANLFIFHIPNQMSTRDLFNLFAPYGNVLSARIMVERDTGRSRGFGFVSFDDPVAASKAVDAVDGCAIHNKRLKVSLKQEGEPRAKGGKGGAAGGGGQGRIEAASGADGEQKDRGDSAASAAGAASGGAGAVGAPAEETSAPAAAGVGGGDGNGSGVSEAAVTTSGPATAVTSQ